MTALKNMPWFHSSFRYPPATIKTPTRPDALANI
nr:MAG TPA: hypothetical protein [Caudoviricetes sp.]